MDLELRDVWQRGLDGRMYLDGKEIRYLTCTVARATYPAMLDTTTFNVTFHDETQVTVSGDTRITIGED